MTERRVCLSKGIICYLRVIKALAVSCPCDLEGDLQSDYWPSVTTKSVNVIGEARRGEGVSGECVVVCRVCWLWWEARQDEELYLSARASLKITFASRHWAPVLYTCV